MLLRAREHHTARLSAAGFAPWLAVMQFGNRAVYVGNTQVVEEVTGAELASPITSSAVAAAADAAQRMRDGESVHTTTTGNVTAGSVEPRAAEGGTRDKLDESGDSDQHSEGESASRPEDCSSVRKCGASLGCIRGCMPRASGCAGTLITGWATASRSS